MADLSPMMRQYLAVKEQNPGTIVLFRVGDFYEMFFDDAKTVSQELELVLTGKECGLEERAPMCGVPFHSVETYIARLVEKGHKVAICEQMEDPALAKGLVKRDVIRVVTPGTLLDSSMLDETRNNYICSLYLHDTTAGICFADISTGEIHAATLQTGTMPELENDIINEFSRYSPREILLNPAALSLSQAGVFIKEKLSAMLECLDDEDYDAARAAELVKNQFPGKTLEDLGLQEQPAIVAAFGALLTYLQRTQKNGIERLNQLDIYSDSQYMRLDMNARRNLELTETLRGKERRGSLLWVLDRTRTAMGKRLIRSWIERPLLSPAKISRRQNAVEELFNDAMLLDEITGQLVGVYDLERIMTRIVYGSANGRDLRSLQGTISKFPALKQTLSRAKSSLLCDINHDLDGLEDIASLIDRAIAEDPPFSIREGGIIREGFHKELDQIKSDMTGGKSLIAEVEARERVRTGIQKLRIGYNRVFGYYIEILNTYKDLVPPDYIRKQTLTNAERYITQELKDLENRILGAHDKSILLETQLFHEVRTQVAGQLERIQRTAGAVAELDVIASLAQVSKNNDYVRPQVNDSGRILLRDSRHPVVEALNKSVPFVPNDVRLDMNENRIAIITGPNMAGKSTYMRQVAIITLMAQIGCFVPASSAEIGLVDAIYTRVGASDDLTAGQSTFMVEMLEVAEILKNATSRSLLILDEIGRGTSTYDGMSIARAVIEYVQNPKLLGAKALFSTHYHELTEMEDQLDGVVNYNIAVKKRGDDLTFLRRIIRGGADDSFGIEAAKLAGIPDKVIRRAKQVLASLEAEGKVPARRSKKVSSDEPVQLTMDSVQNDIMQKLKNLDVNTLTPIECMNTLFELANLAKQQ